MKRTLILLGLAAAAFAAAFAATRVANAPPAAPPGMVWVPGGEFTMGTDSDLGWPDEKPAHRVRVGGFFADETEVTNAQFRGFVAATGYVTTAEKPPDVQAILKRFPGAEIVDVRDYDTAAPADDIQTEKDLDERCRILAP